MSSIAASALLTGAPDVTVAAVRASRAYSGQSTAQQDQAWKKDPEVKQAADAIFQKLAVSRDAKSLDEILKEVPTVSHDLAVNALKRLLYEGRIKRTGQGTKADPYRYYNVVSGHEG